MRDRFLFLLAWPAAAMAQTGVTILPGESAMAISYDGRWVVGAGDLWNQTARQTYRWSAGTGPQGLGAFAGEARGSAMGVSADGSVVVGHIFGSAAYRWTAATGKRPIGTVAGHTQAHARAVSGDGSTIIGNSMPMGGAFIWTAEQRITPLDWPGLSNVVAQAISADGMIVVGWGVRADESTPFRWEVGAPQPQPLHGEWPAEAYAISPDGRFIAGCASTATALHGFIWNEADGYAILPRTARHECVLAIANDASTAVGYGLFVGVGYRAVIWVREGPGAPYQVFRLEDYLEQRGLTLPVGRPLFAAYGISARGDVIVGGHVSGDPLATGSAYRVKFCYANCDESTTAPYLSADDFSCFINRFAVASGLPHEQQLYHWANCDHSSTPPVLNIDDFTCFMNRFAVGCETP